MDPIWILHGCGPRPHPREVRSGDPSAAHLPIPKADSAVRTRDGGMAPQKEHAQLDRHDNNNNGRPPFFLRESALSVCKVIVPGRHPVA